MNTRFNTIFYTPSENNSPALNRVLSWPSWLRVFLLVLLIMLVGLSIAGEFFAWPGADEAIITLKGKLIANGQIPYRDFNEFITPLSEIITAGIITVFGYHYMMIRGMVLLGYCLSYYLIWNMAKPFLPLPWRVLLLLFLWQTDTRYLVNQHHFWSGLLALFAIYCCFQWRIKQWQLADNQKNYIWIILSSLCCGFTCWTTQTAGLAISLAIFIYLLLQVFKKENPVPFKTLPFFIIPILSVGVIGCFWLIQLGAWDNFVLDSFVWLTDGHYSNTTVLGYFVTGQQELYDTIVPLLAPLPFNIKLLFLPRIFIYLHLILIALLPLLGLVYAGYHTVSTTHTEKRSLLFLYLSTGMALLLSTLSYSTSMHIVSNGSMLYLLAFIGLYTLSKNFKTPSTMLKTGFIFSVCLLIATIIASSSKLAFGTWVNPANSNSIQGTYLHTGQGGKTEYWQNLFSTLNQSQNNKQNIFVLGQLPEIYMLSGLNNPTRFPMVIPIYTSKVQQQEIVESLEKNPPPIIIQDNSYTSIRKDPRFKAYPKSELKLNVIENWVGCHYDKTQFTGPFTLYQLSKTKVQDCNTGLHFRI